MRTIFFLLTMGLGVIQAQTDCLIEAEFITSTELWGEEVSWTLTDASGNLVASGSEFESNAQYTTTACLEDSCYTLTLLDTFGDGWNGATLDIQLPILGLNLGTFTLEEGDAQVFSFGLGDCGNNGGNPGGSVQDVWGCMDPVADNYDVNATVDCCCTYPEDCSTSNTLTVLQSGAADTVFFGFLEYTITSLDGFAWYPTSYSVNENGQWLSEGCITDGCYTLTLHSNFGLFEESVDVLLNGILINSFSVDPGQTQMSFGLGINVEGCEAFVLGCTDSEAPNFNPDATADDGTCLEPCDCPDVFDPVCGYDYYSGQTVTFNNLCELECASAYFQWEGDCSEIPVYGCMDPEALNHDENATVDSGSCQYIPECGDDHLVVMSSQAAFVDSLNGGFFGAGVSGYFTGLEGYVNSFIGVYDELGQYTSYGCMADGCYNFYVYSGGWTPGGAIEVTVDETTTTFVLGPNEFESVFPFGINADDCEVYIPGCTDPEALNYHPSATEDDGSCQYPFSCPDNQVAGMLYVCTFQGGEEVALTITDSQGNVVYDQQGYPNLTIDHIDICLDPEECYSATMTNLAGGTSWNGGYFWIHVNNAEWVNGALEGSTSETLEFGTGDDCAGITNPGGNDFLFGCTDPNALNHNPLATFDDGSCIYEDTTGGGDTTDVSLDCDGLNLVSGLFISADPFLNEVSWALLDEDSTAVLSGNGQDANTNGALLAVQNCLPDGCYVLELYDSFGDGWGGGLLILTTDNGALTFTLDGDFASFPFDIGAGCEEILTITGCTDAGAMNYNPEANEEDGSCEFASCPLVEVKFVTYTFSDGDEIAWTVSGEEADGGSEVTMSSVPFGDNEMRIHTTCMAPGCYSMTLHDAGDNGWNEGWLEIWMDGELMTTATHSPNGENNMDFGIGMDCSDDPGMDGTITNWGMSGWNNGVDLSPYPTPTGEIVNILGSGFDNESPVVVRVRDGMGRLVQERKVQPSEGPEGWIFDVSGWSAGIYTVEGLQGRSRAEARFIVAR